MFAFQQNFAAAPISFPEPIISLRMPDEIISLCSVIGFQNNKETYRSNTSQSTKGLFVLQEVDRLSSFIFQ